MLAVRLFVMGLGLLLGWLAGQALASAQPTDLNRVNTLSLMLAGSLIALLFAPRAEKLLTGSVGRFSRWYAGLSPRTVAAATFGLIVALLLSVLLSSLFQSLPFFNWFWNLLVTVILAVFFVNFAVGHAEAFGMLAFPQVRRRSGSKLLDSNVIIDGRILELVRAGFLDGELVVPGFILRELQLLSDSGDAQKRTRGKRGLGLVEELRELKPIRIEDWDDAALKSVDDKLIRLARETGGQIVTNDGNLGKIAKLHGVTVLSVNEAAVALKPQVQAGDLLAVTITKGGQQSGQGVGYLEDGTMVVVEDGLKFRGKQARVQVVNNVQTNVGRMIFAKLEREEVA
ncbi:PIN/TRAM domain-containing protein [Deinococcus marmoris]|uniref:Membrane-associated protein containing RNA-binding TRAM domain and ribonuclease PIN-domain n=1 Tax=Deinococcus marmoris TaxID=249408 RepID=A0A1U7P4E4_9DEIO|nr:twitching motility protein PilT [Deinococcus marmoris]OLV20030.1 Membrane-associated protein containing RNA-binding TRAM domain and ribonuclease PIN-domain [Deinococcus marmoris]